MSEHEALLNLIHREVLRVLHRSTRRTPVVVDGYDPKTHAAKFKLMPDSVSGDPVITGWIPLQTQQTGNNFGWHMPPNIGDHGWLEFHDDDREAGTFVHASFNDKFQPVDTVKAGEWFYKHKNGASIYYKDDGSVNLTDKAGNFVNMDGTGTVTINDKNGNKLVLDSSGNVQVIPGSGKFVFLGGTGADGSYDFVLTASAPSVNVKAKVS